MAISEICNRAEELILLAQKEEEPSISKGLQSCFQLLSQVKTPSKPEKLSKNTTKLIFLFQTFAGKTLKTISVDKEINLEKRHRMVELAFRCEMLHQRLKVHSFLEFSHQALLFARRAVPKKTLFKPKVHFLHLEDPSRFRKDGIERFSENCFLELYGHKHNPNANRFASTLSYLIFLLEYSEKTKLEEHRYFKIRRLDQYSKSLAIAKKILEGPLPVPKSDFITKYCDWLDYHIKKGILELTGQGSPPPPPEHQPDILKEAVQVDYFRAPPPKPSKDDYVLVGFPEPK